MILDGRAGVQAIESKRKHELQKQVDEDLRLEILTYEKNFILRVDLIAGVDEVGRGSLWLAPVVAAANTRKRKIPGLNDSKKIPKSKHKEKYEGCAPKNAIAIGISIKDNQVIDQVNIHEATEASHDGGHWSFVSTWHL